MLSGFLKHQRKFPWMQTALHDEHEKKKRKKVKRLKKYISELNSSLSREEQGEFKKPKKKKTQKKHNNSIRNLQNVCLNISSKNGLRKTTLVMTYVEDQAVTTEIKLYIFNPHPQIYNII